MLMCGLPWIQTISIEDFWRISCLVEIPAIRLVSVLRIEYHFGHGPLSENPLLSLKGVSVHLDNFLFLFFETIPDKWVFDFLLLLWADSSLIKIDIKVLFLGCLLVKLDGVIFLELNFTWCYVLCKFLNVFYQVLAG